MISEEILRQWLRTEGTIFLTANSTGNESYPPKLFRIYPAFFCQWGRCSKVIHAKPDGIAPLGNIGARYIKDLTLCILLPCSMPTRHEWRRLENSILRIAQVFEGSGHELRSLVAEIGLGRRTIKHITTDRLEVSSSNGLRMQVRNIENEGGVEPQNMERLARFMAPLGCMEGVKDLRLSGLLTAEIMHAYKAELQRRVAEGFEDQPTAKRP